MTEQLQIRLEMFDEILKRNARSLRKELAPDDDNTVILPQFFQELYIKITGSVGVSAARDFVKLVASATEQGGDVKVKYLKRLISNNWIWQELPEDGFHIPPNGSPVTLIGGPGDSDADFLKRHLRHRDFVKWHGRNRSYVLATHNDC